MTTENRRKLWCRVSAVSGPLVIVLAARVLMAPPAAVSAASQEGQKESFFTTSSSSSISPQQQQVLDWCMAIDYKEPWPSPIGHLPAPSASASVIGPHGNATERSDSPVAGLRLSMVLGRPGAAMARINGVVYRIDDQVRPGLYLSKIDVRQQQIELIGTDGETYVLTTK